MEGERLQHTILIVEDDTDINNLLASILVHAGYGVTQAFSGTEGRLLLDNGAFSLVLLDLMLPGMTGEVLIDHIRIKKDMPIIVLSAKGTGTDKVNALRAGADDYVTKPFDDKELLARIEANLRRGAGNSTAPILTHKGLQLDRDTHSVTVDGESVSLTAREYDILELLLSNPKKVFTKENLYQSVWNSDFVGDDKTIGVHISNLRAKLRGDYIQTIWGIGFRLAE